MGSFREIRESTDSSINLSDCVSHVEGSINWLNKVRQQVIASDDDLLRSVLAELRTEVRSVLFELRTWFLDKDSAFKDQHREEYKALVLCGLLS